MALASSFRFVLPKIVATAAMMENAKIAMINPNTDQVIPLLAIVADSGLSRAKINLKPLNIKKPNARSENIVSRIENTAKITSIIVALASPFGNFIGCGKFVWPRANNGKRKTASSKTKRK